MTVDLRPASRCRRPPPSAGAGRRRRPRFLPAPCLAVRCLPHRAGRQCAKPPEQAAGVSDEQRAAHISPATASSAPPASASVSIGCQAVELTHGHHHEHSGDRPPQAGSGEAGQADSLIEPCVTCGEPMPTASWAAASVYAANSCGAALRTAAASLTISFRTMPAEMPKLIEGRCGPQARAVPRPERACYMSNSARSSWRGLTWLGWAVAWPGSVMASTSMRHADNYRTHCCGYLLCRQARTSATMLSCGFACKAGV